MDRRVVSVTAGVNDDLLGMLFEQRSAEEIMKLHCIGSRRGAARKRQWVRLGLANAACVADVNFDWPTTQELGVMPEYNYLVRVKTSITLPADLLQTIDRINSNRSDFIEKASRANIARIERARRDARDIEIINRNAKRLNAEARDAMGYQKLP
jgi:hypothetical protein